MRHWTIKCPYCNGIISEGTGYLTTPEVGIPFVRCTTCGELIRTGSNEYLTIPPQVRRTLKKSSENRNYIEESLDRTNNKEYIEVLKNNGLVIYPLRNGDVSRFSKIRFEKYINKLPSAYATSSLYDCGILIKKEDKVLFDKQTGGFKKEILEKNLELTRRSNVMLGWGAFFGILVGIISGILFGLINPDYSMLFLLGFPIGLVAFVTIALLIDRYYKRKDNKSKDNKSNNKSKPPKKISIEINKNDINYIEISKCDINYLEKLYDEGILSKDEYKEKALQIIDKTIGDKEL